jgi:hypothetical protein
LLSETDQLDLVAFFGKYSMRLVWVSRCPLGFVVTLEGFTAIRDAHRRFGAAFTSDRFFRTALPVDSDLIRTIITANTSHSAARWSFNRGAFAANTGDHAIGAFALIGPANTIAAFHFFLPPFLVAGF